MDASELNHLAHGTKVTINQKQDMWYKITYKNLVGWVCKYSLSDSNPLDQSIIKKIDTINLNKIARKRASTYSTAATTRGITEKDETVEISLNYAAVKEMEYYHPTKTEITDFKSKGSLK